MNSDINSNYVFLRNIRRATLAHLEAEPELDPLEAVKRGLNDTYPVSGEVMAEANIEYLTGKADYPQDRWTGSPTIQEIKRMDQSTPYQGSRRERGLSMREAQELATKND